MALSTRTLFLAVLGCSLAICFLPTVRSLVFGLDFGSRWIKMSVIRGNQFEIVLDAQAKRKFFSGLTFYDDERFFASDAEKMMPRSPQHTYAYLSQLLGKTFNSSIVEELKPYILYAEGLVPDGERGTVAVQYENETIGVDVLAAMVLNYARQTAEHYVQVPVADVVITVPSYFSIEERTAVIEVAKLAGFNVLSLINDGTSIALHYAFGKKFEEPKNVLFYDMGHSTTRATLVEYHSIHIKKGAKNMTQPTMKVKAATYDMLGGRDFDYRFAEYLAGVAVKQMGAKGMSSSVEAIKANKKAWARLTTAASQAKTVLSANSETFVAVEGLVGDYDLKTTVTRTQFEELCNDLFARAARPVLDALALADMKIEDVSSVELVGGSVRIPRVQAVLKEQAAIPVLSTTINQDEAAVLGAVLYAAHQSTSIKVPEHKIRDIAPYGVTATIKISRPADELDPAAGENGDDEEEETKRIDAADSDLLEGEDGGDDDADDAEMETEDQDGTVTKVLSLFKPFSRIGAKKNISFRKTVSNFTVELDYDGETKLPENTPDQIALYTFESTALAKLDKYNYTGNPKLTLTFRLDTSGLPALEKTEAEVVVIKHVEVATRITPDPSVAASAETTNDDKEEEEEKKESDKEEEKEGEGEEVKETTTKEEEKETKKETKKEPKKVVHKVPLSPVVQKLGIPERSVMDQFRARTVMQQWEDKAAFKREKADAKNDLETYIYYAKERLWDEELEKVSTEEQRDEAREALDAAADWLEGEGLDVSTQEYRTKTMEISLLARAIFERMAEYTKRPAVTTRLQEMLNRSRASLAGILEHLDMEMEEKEELLDLVEETDDWLNNKLKEQEKRAPHEEPAYRSEHVQAKYNSIDKLLRKLMKKKLKPTPTPEGSAEVPEAPKNPTSQYTTEAEEQEEQATAIPTATTTEEEVAQGEVEEEELTLKNDLNSDSSEDII